MSNQCIVLSHFSKRVNVTFTCNFSLSLHRYFTQKTNTKKNYQLKIEHVVIQIHRNRERKINHNLHVQNILFCSENIFLYGTFWIGFSEESGAAITHTHMKFAYHFFKNYFNGFLHGELMIATKCPDGFCFELFHSEIYLFLSHVCNKRLNEVNIVFYYEFN